MSTLDSSGNGHMHSLHYLLPLLRDGVRRNDHPMVARFYALLADWVKDNPPRPSGAAWNVEIVEGYRALTLVCAAAGPQGQAPWLRAALVQHAAWFASSAHYNRLGRMPATVVARNAVGISPRAAVSVKVAR